MRTNRSSTFSTDWTVETGPPVRASLSINTQWHLLGIPRSSYFNQPVGESAEYLALMHQNNKLFTAWPEMGIRRLQKELITEVIPK